MIVIHLYLHASAWPCVKHIRCAPVAVIIHGAEEGMHSASLFEDGDIELLKHPIYILYTEAAFIDVARQICGHSGK